MFQNFFGRKTLIRRTGDGVLLRGVCPADTKPCTSTAVQTGCGGACLSPEVEEVEACGSEVEGQLLTTYQVLGQPRIHDNVFEIENKKRKMSLGFLNNYFTCMSVLSTYMYLYHIHAATWEARSRNAIPLNGS